MTSAKLCLNCDHPLADRFCQRCGQDAHSHARSFGHIVHEVLESLVHMDSALWRTLRPLLLRPGEVTYEYLQGRRARYTPPFRLYVLLSLAFFVVISSGDQVRMVSVGSDQSPVFVRFSDQRSCEAVADRLKLWGWLRPGYLKSCHQTHLDGGRALTRELWEATPKAFFLLVPVFALVTKILFLRSGRLYVEHLVFITYLHSAAFLSGTLVAITSLIMGLLPEVMGGVVLVSRITLVSVLLIYGCVYIALAMRRVFQQRWWLTLTKSLVLVGAYLFLVTWTIVGVVLVTLAAS